MDEKRTYESPVVDVVLIDALDIIKTSGNELGKKEELDFVNP